MHPPSKHNLETLPAKGKMVILFKLYYGVKNEHGDALGHGEVDHWAVDAYAAKIEAARCAKEMFNTLAQAGAVLNENDFSKKGGQFNLYRRQRIHFHAQPIKESVNV